MAKTLSSQVSAFVQEKVTLAREGTRKALGHLQAVDAEKVVQNGVRASLSSAIRKLGELDDQYATLLRLVHETYGPADGHGNHQEEN